MSASAQFTIEGSATTSAIAVAAAATVDLALVSITGVRTVAWSIIGGSDDAQSTPTITPAGSPLGATATFTMTSPVGAVGVGWLVRCVVNGGEDDEGSTVAALTATGVVGVINSNGYVPFIYGELNERSVTHGIAPDFNEQLVLAGFGGEPMPAGTTDGATARWETTGAEWIESTTLLLDEPAGIATVRRSSIGVTANAALVVHNPTAAALGAQQYSGAIVQQGEAWATGAGARREVYSRTQVRGIQGTTVTPHWVLAIGEAAEGTAADAASLTDVLDISTSSADFKTLNVVTTGFMSVGTSPAQSGGGLRVPNNVVAVSARRTDAADANLLYLNSSNILIVGDEFLPVANYRSNVATSGTFTLRVNNVTEAVLSATSLDLQDNNLFTTGRLYAGSVTTQSEEPGSVVAVATTTNVPRGVVSWQHSTDAGAARLSLYKSRGTRSSPTVVSDASGGDGVGAIGFSAYDGSAYHERAFIQAFIDAAVVDGSDTVPMALRVATGRTAANIHTIWASNGAQTHNCDAATVISTWQVNSTSKGFIDGNGLSVHELRVGTGTTPATDNGYMKITAGTGSSDGMLMVCKFPTAGEIAVLSADETSAFGSTIALGGTAAGQPDVYLVTRSGGKIGFLAGSNGGFVYDDTADTYEWYINNALKMTRTASATKHTSTSTTTTAGQANITLADVPIATGVSGIAIVRITARDQTNGDSAGYAWLCTFENTGGTVAIVGTNTAMHTGEEDATWASDVVASGANLRVRATATDASNSIKWNVNVDFLEGSP